MEFTLNLPDEVFMKGLNGKLEGKSILVRSCSSVFRFEFAYRRKQGFVIPLGEFMGDKAFFEFWHDQIQPCIQRRDIFRPVMAWMNRINKCTLVQLGYPWMMLFFEVWAQNVSR